MKIELLYFDGCPSWQDGLENRKVALAEEGLDLPVDLIKVPDEVDAERLKFLGSPLSASMACTYGMRRVRITL